MTWTWLLASPAVLAAVLLGLILRPATGVHRGGRKPSHHPRPWQQLAATRRRSRRRSSRRQVAVRPAWRRVTTWPGRITARLLDPGDGEEVRNRDVPDVAAGLSAGGWRALSPSAPADSAAGSGSVTVSSPSPGPRWPLPPGPRDWTPRFRPGVYAPSWTTSRLPDGWPADQTATDLPALARAG